MQHNQLREGGLNEHGKQPELSRAIRLERAEGDGSNRSANPTMGEIIARRFSRRDIMKGTLAITAITATVSPMTLLATDKARAQGATKFDFAEVEAGVD